MRLLLADDHAMFRECLIMLISTQFPHFEWHQAGDWHEVHRILNQQPIDLALLDLGMPGYQPWPDEIRQLSATHPALAVCILSATTAPEVIQSAFQLGIKGYIPKLLCAEELQHAISLVSSGKTYLPSQLWENMAIPSGCQVKSSLTQRQYTIVQLLAQGHSNKQISLELNLAEGTVKRHMHNIFQALGAKNRVEAVKAARQRGLLA
ncbi:LuxR C-terminal-related transcriptional regulator [Thiothrix nivea]|uniref:Two component transcriptional regulator, LuxR family n=1 Tax=Thiothrix nivea (strain ATCC 35100 / DSM 5205 / JP2) TaxID=870187 RepID=A0A656HKJ7_THINJ|nr:response regulator transcription factor [Thiothrix nivea]EIJ35799.1 two component transcriptional regulator, LuxR family [Thiothrix nivea DSM 5205]